MSEIRTNSGDPFGGRRFAGRVELFEYRGLYNERRKVGEALLVSMFENPDGELRLGVLRPSGVFSVVRPDLCRAVFEDLEKKNE